MISPRSFTEDWILEVSRRYKAQKILMEKNIRALSLLEGLAESKLQFVFKGGTALMLMQKEPRRLSIDIDIIVPPQEADIDSVLQSVVETKGFVRVEKKIRQQGNKVPKCHYKLFYNSVVEGKVSRVLLDVLFEQVLYSRLVEIPIESPFIVNDGDARRVKVPDFNNILADKMTAFAPRTVGVPYRKGNVDRGMEIIKQLYDIDVLFDKVNDIRTITSTYRAFAEQETRYREAKFTVEDILRDTMDNALAICFRRDHNGAEFSVLALGFKQVDNHIFSESYHLEKGILSAAKTAYVASLIFSQADEIVRFDRSRMSEMMEWNIADPNYSKLNKLKKTNQEAFFYLSLALRNIGIE